MTATQGDPADAGRSAPRRRAVKKPERGPSHADILYAVDRLSARQDEAERGQDLHVMAMQRIEKAVAEGFAAVEVRMAAIGANIGSEGEDQYGKPVGTGVVGRLMRMEHRIGRYDGWVRWASGAVAALALAGAVIWWLVQNRLGFLQ